MNYSRTTTKAPEVIELEKKERECLRYAAERAEVAERCNSLRQEIRQFEQRYEEIVGIRLRELDELEERLKQMHSGSHFENISIGNGEQVSFPHIHTTDDLFESDDVSVSDRSKLTIKALFRRVAKAVHPDLAVSERERIRRQELMSVANQAYESGNRSVLMEILADWEQGPEMITGKDIGSELVRVIRLIAQHKQSIHSVSRQIEELRQSESYGLKQRVDQAAVRGKDLLGEMASTVEQKMFRLRIKINEQMDTRAVVPDAPVASVIPTRSISFPDEYSCGTLFVRDIQSMDYRDWQRFGNARGNKEIPLDKGVRLDVRGSTEMEMRFLDEIKPDDLTAIFLYEVDDDALLRFQHLTGLRELYLSNAQVTDQGLASLAPLAHLQRISIYHTPVTNDALTSLALLPTLRWLTCSGTQITEEGLKQFRKIRPRCKAVNFSWPYGRNRS